MFATLSATFLRIKNIVLSLLVFFSISALANVTVVDDLGRTIVLAKPAERIVALAPHIVENLFVAGVGDRIVGVVDYSDYPDAAKTIERVGGYGGISLEAVVGLSPDLVIVWASGYGNSMQFVQKLQSLDIPVYVDEPHKLEDVAKSISDFGRLAGSRAESERAANRYLEKLGELRARYAQRETVSTFYQIWNEPLQTLNGEHIVSDVVRLCGGSNIFADESILAPRVNIESVLALDPDVIFASETSEGRPAWLANWKQWPSLTAVQRSQIFTVPPDLLQRHTVRLLDGAAILCEQLESVRAER